MTLAPMTVALILVYRQRDTARVMAQLRRAVEVRGLRHPVWFLTALFFILIAYVLEFGILRCAGNAVDRPDIVSNNALCEGGQPDRQCLNALVVPGHATATAGILGRCSGLSRMARFANGFRTSRMMNSVEPTANAMPRSTSRRFPKRNKVWICGINAISAEIAKTAAKT